MKLPKLFRKLTPILAIVFSVFLVLAMFLGGDLSSVVSKILWFMFYVVLVAFVVNIIGLLTFRPIANALLRRFGESATATVLAVAGTNESVNRVGVYRVRLEVHPASGGSFIAVAEDAIRIVNMVGSGDTVSVKYDPRSKEVALVMPAKAKWKKADF
jgi:hypothetical protein